MFFEDEPDHIKKARQAPLTSTWESRQPPKHDTAKNPIEAQVRTMS